MFMARTTHKDTQRPFHDTGRLNMAMTQNVQIFSLRRIACICALLRGFAPRLRPQTSLPKSSEIHKLLTKL